MLLIYSEILAFQDDARVLVASIAQFDANLASQLRRSAQSVALNTAEGMSARAGHRRNAYATACREARECQGAIDVAQRWEYIDVLSEEVAARLSRIIGTLTKLSRPHGK